MGFHTDAQPFLTTAQEFTEYLNSRIEGIIEEQAMSSTDDFGEDQEIAAAVIASMWDIHAHTGMPAEQILDILALPLDGDDGEALRLEALYQFDEDAVDILDENQTFLDRIRNGEKIQGTSMYDMIITDFGDLHAYMENEDTGFGLDAQSINHAAEEFQEYINLSVERLMSAVALDNTEVLGEKFQVSAASCAVAVYQVHVASGEDADTILGRLAESTLESDEDYEDPHRREFAEAVHLNLEINGESAWDVVLAAYAAVHEYMDS